ncbi:MAG: transcription elongation protein SprT [Cyclobacteriaceae bacterium]|nr:transcription elongation protein SprT [Cyclobacteriaceae bacterium]
MISEQLQPHLPPTALAYCVHLWQQNPFKFKLSKKRFSKAGDFSCRTGSTPRITVNKDLTALEFLITYVHEVAHLHVHRQHGHSVEAHGLEWKRKFQELMQPVLSEHIFPEPIFSCLHRHLQNPMASTYSDAELTRLLHKGDPRTAKTVYLADLPEGSTFDLNGRFFKKGKLKRTRVLCTELKSKKQFLVPADAPVGHAQLTLWG